MNIQSELIEKDIKLEQGSFKDPYGRIYIYTTHNKKNKRILRFLTNTGYENLRNLTQKPFYQDLTKQNLVIPTYESNISPELYGWDNVVEHEMIPFITYPYEWPFSMLKDAALLHLEILRTSIINGWTLKDSSSFNIQWKGTNPVFIDIPSFISREDKEYWVGYNQFCNMFLYPLLLTSHLGIDFHSLLRSNLEGITLQQIRSYFRWSDFKKRGVFPHILLPSLLSVFTTKIKSNVGKQQSTKNLLMLINSLYNSINKLKFNTHIEKNNFTSKYDKIKKSIIQKWTYNDSFQIAWDINAGSGYITEVIAEKSETVIAMNSSHKTADLLYQHLTPNSNIIPLVIDISNISPNQGWQGLERKSLDNRANIDIILCLNMIQNIRVVSDIPLSSFIEWLRKQKTRCIIEYIDKTDPTVQKLLINKYVIYIDYTRRNFLLDVHNNFHILNREKISETRELFDIIPKIM